MHPVTDMETRQLFFTMRMIWNHSCPPEHQLKPFKKYSKFDDFYTNKYVSEALYHIYDELMTRNDMTDYYKQQLALMRGAFEETFELLGE